MLHNAILVNQSSGGGGSSATLGSKTITANGTYDPANDNLDGYNAVTVSVPASAVDSGTKSITANGSNQDVVGYAAVDVNVPNSYAAGDEGKVVSSGALVSQSSTSYNSNGTYDTTLINSVTVNVPAGLRKVTGTITGNGKYTISISGVSSKPVIIVYYRSDKGNLTAVSDRATAYGVIVDGVGGGSCYTAASSTSLSNAGFQAGSIADSTSPSQNRAAYSGTTLYIRSGNNSNLWSTSLTYNYELYFAS